MAIKNNYPTIRPSLDLNFASSKVVDPRVTFTRPSTATYYDGKTVAKAEENLWINSSTLLLSVPAAVTRTSNAAVAPDGTTTAFSIIPTAANGVHASGYAASVPATAEKPVTLSFHAKANGYTKLWFAESSNARFYGLVDLNTAVITSSGGGGLVTASAKLLENGWVRVFITVNNIGNLSLCPVPDSGYTTNIYGSATFAGDGVSGCYLWGFQAEQRAFATAYTPTTDQPITRYQPVLMTAAANTPRIDHDPITGECKGLLIEESRTNLLLQSEFGTGISAIGTVSGIVTDATMFGPSGTHVDAAAFGHDGVTTSRIYKYTTLPSLEYTLSVFVRMDDGMAPVFGSSTDDNAANDFALRVGGGGGSPLSYTVKHVGNGLYRVSVTGISSTGLTERTGIVKFPTNSPRTFKTTGWQVEAGAFPTSYIKTEASQVTRAADSAVMTGANFSSWYRQDEGSLTTDFSTIGFSPTDRYFWRIYGDSGFSNGHSFRNFNGGLVFASNANSVLEAQVGFGSTAPFASQKVSISYKTNDFAGSLNGAPLVKDGSGVTPINLNSLLITGSGCWHLKRLTCYPKRLSDAQLRALTL